MFPRLYEILCRNEKVCDNLSRSVFRQVSAAAFWHGLQTYKVACSRACLTRFPKLCEWSFIRSPTVTAVPQKDGFVPTCASHATSSATICLHEQTAEVGRAEGARERLFVGLASRTAPPGASPLAGAPVGDSDSGLQPFFKCKLTGAVRAAIPPPETQPTSQAAARR